MHQDNQREGRYNGFVTSPLTNCGGPTDLDKFNMTPGHHHINDKSPRKFNPEETAYFYAMYPNVAITIYPHSVYTLIMHPNGPGRAKEKLTVLQHPGARLSTDSDAEYEEKTKGVMDFVCEVNDEDIEICERLDKGVRQNAYTGGMYAPNMEHTAWRFHNMLADSMTGDRRDLPILGMGTDEENKKAMSSASVDVSVNVSLVQTAHADVPRTSVSI
jgi:choline monooxygenase